MINEPGDDEDDDKTHIVWKTPQQPPPDDHDATRILPAKSTQTPEEVAGKVIGVATAAQSAAGGGDDEEEGRTVFLPTGASEPSEPAFDPPVGWLAITKGPGRGNHCPIYHGQNSMGRGANQRIRLNFGDLRIARDSHAFIVYDEVGHKFYLRDNGKANLVRLNDAPVMAPMELNNRDFIAIGDTVLIFVALCGDDFDWLGTGGDSPTGVGD